MDTPNHLQGAINRNPKQGVLVYTECLGSKASELPSERSAVIRHSAAGLDTGRHAWF